MMPGMPTYEDLQLPFEQQTVAVRDFGGIGAAVLLLHGAGGNLAHWSAVAPLLSSRYRLVAVDLPSHGASSSPGTFSFDGDVAAVDHVRVTLGLTDAAVVGHSYGGMLAVVIGARGGYRTAVNVDGIGFRVPGSPLDDARRDTGGGDPPPQSGDDAWREAELATDAEEVASMGLELSPGSELFQRGIQLGADGLWHRAPTLDRFLELVRDAGRQELLPTYAATRCRTVTIVAERRDGPTEEHIAASRRHAQMVRAALAELPEKSPARQVEIVATGHYPHLEAPAELATALDSLLGG
jgi:pimeloyl-ACP methyl ester carboxylesterase